ncbi:SIR2 family protein [Candidatus Peregrinibacteria bacterium]|nr:SIR2 family protein [Candidatus Peregrinibacteria bacterium]
MHDLIILTGAGFTANFGGFLSPEMWARILNNPLIQKKKCLREELLNDFDFEEVHYHLFHSRYGQYSDEDRVDFMQAVEEAYKHLDERIKGWRASENPLRTCIEESFGIESKQERKFIFTLNQDLFVERVFHYKPAGVQAFKGDIYEIDSQIKKTDFVKLPEEKSLEELENDINSYKGPTYIKLHGSYGWISGTGANQLVIGMNKKEDIEKEPLLKAYYNFFEEVIASTKKILVIGYGFGDTHINRVLYNGIEKSNLKLYIVNPTLPKFLKTIFHTQAPRIKLGNGTPSDPPADPYKFWGSVSGYFPYTLNEIFPHGVSDGSILRELKLALQNG